MDVVDEDVAVEDIVDEDIVGEDEGTSVNTASCSVLSAVPVVLLHSKIGTLKIEVSAPSTTKTVKKSYTFFDLLSMSFFRSTRSGN